jgi:hypothetical protein
MSNPNAIESRALIIQWQGKAFGLENQKRLIAAMVDANVISVNNPTIVELSGEDLAKAAYLKAVMGNDVEVKLPEDIDPILHSIEIVGTRYNGLNSNQFTVKIFGDIIAEVHKRSVGLSHDLELITAMDILANHTITQKYSNVLKKYGVTKTMLETIRNAYNAYHVNQAEFI